MPVLHKLGLGPRLRIHKIFALPGGEPLSAQRRAQASRRCRAVPRRAHAALCFATPF